MAHDQTDKFAKVRGRAPMKTPTVSVLAAATSHSDCPVAMIGLASHTDLDKLCAGSDYEAPFGQDPQAFQRGQMFEALIKRHGYSSFIALLREHAGFPIGDVRIANLRAWAPKNDKGLVMRAAETRKLLAKIARCDADAPNLIDGAVLTARIGSTPAYFEADGLAAAAGGRIQVAEIKSFPFTDGRCDAEKLGAAKNQAAWYAMLCKLTLRGMGLADDAVDSHGFIILPKGVSLRPTLLVENLKRHIERACQQLQTASQVGAVLRASDDVRFPHPDDEDRFDRLEDLMERLGTSYRGDCLAQCGLARLCRERAHDCGMPSLSGVRVAQQLSGIRSLRRAIELTQGAPAAPQERHAMQMLGHAARLYDRVLRRGEL